MRVLLIAALLSLTTSGCTTDQNLGNRPGEDSGSDSALDSQSDSARVDGGVDARADGPSRLDTGADATPDGPRPDADAAMMCTATCDASSCGTRICGRSDCGYLCGRCASDAWCFAGGASCVAGVGPGDVCAGALGDPVWEGDEGFRVCPTDPSLVQRCTCSGGGPDAWFGCGTCIDLCVADQPGALCTSDRDCGSLGCHPSLQLCGVRCDRGLGAVCGAGSTCFIPGDLAGVCLQSCSTCGSAVGCPSGSTCGPSEIGGTNLVCVPDSYGAPACP